MKILVTGHRGFIGQNIIKWFKANTQWTVNGWDIQENSSFPDIKNYDWVIHLGAITSTTEQNVKKVLEYNTEFSKTLYTLCQVNSVNFQYASSASVYGLESDFLETSPCIPQTPYAWSKYLFEFWLSKQSINNNIVQGFRYFNVYGNYEDHKSTQASPVSKFSLQNPIQLFKNSAEYKRDFVAVEDVCRVHADFIKNIKTSGIWNIGTGKPRSFQSIANLISKRNNSSIEYIEMPNNLRLSYQKYTCANLTKLENTLGLQNWISVEEWLNKYKIVGTV